MSSQGKNTQAPSDTAGAPTSSESQAQVDKSHGRLLLPFQLLLDQGSFLSLPTIAPNLRVFSWERESLHEAGQLMKMLAEYYAAEGFIEFQTSIMAVMDALYEHMKTANSLQDVRAGLDTAYKSWRVIERQERCIRKGWPVEAKEEGTLDNARKPAPADNNRQAEKTGSTKAPAQETTEAKAKHLPFRPPPPPAAPSTPSVDYQPALAEGAERKSCFLSLIPPAARLDLKMNDGPMPESCFQARVERALNLGKLKKAPGLEGYYTNEEGGSDDESYY